MRKIDKLSIPKTLQENADQWTAEFQADPTNATKKYRYRDPSIKRQLVEETSNKCVYCESKIGHNTPGDVEHKIPTKVNKALHFSWPNLTVACTECNRRKNDYFDTAKPFLDPYSDDVEDLVVHRGPIAAWKVGHQNAEISVRVLELEGKSRANLIARKIEKIDELNNLMERIHGAQDELLKAVLLLSLKRKADRTEEYSAMVRSILINECLLTA